MRKIKIHIRKYTIFLARLLTFVQPFKAQWVRYCGVFAPCGSLLKRRNLETRLRNNTGRCFLRAKPRISSPPLAMPRFPSLRALLGDAVNTELRNSTECGVFPQFSVTKVSSRFEVTSKVK
jgi:hypothetical protein